MIELQFKRKVRRCEMDKKESRYERRAKISKEIEKVLIEHDVTFLNLAE
jgi:hypothetical protein